MFIQEALKRNLISDGKIIDERRVYKYRDLYDQVNKLTSSLNKYYSSKIVGICLPNSYLYLVAYFSVAFMNKIILPIRPDHTPFEIKSIIENCQISLLITDSQHIEILRENKTIYNLICYNIEIDKIVILGEYHLNLNTYNIPSNIEILLGTSGTTGKQKFAMLSGKNLESNINSIIKSLDLKNTERSLIIMPLYLSSGNIQLLTHIFLGATIILYKGIPFPTRIKKMIQDYRVTNFCCVNIIGELLLKDEKDLSSKFKTVTSLGIGAGIVSPDLMKKLVNYLPNTKIYQFYGQTEASPRISHCIEQNIIVHPNSVGRPLKGIEIKIVNSNGEICTPYEIGEILVKGPNVMVGYYNNSNATEETIKNGYLHTGDLGYIDKDGYLYLKGRIKNLIISNGQNVYPEEIEYILKLHSSVKDAYVYSISDNLYEEKIIAEIESDIKSLDINILFDHCKKYLALYKIPKIFKIVDHIDKTINGKIIRKR